LEDAHLPWVFHLYTPAADNAISRLDGGTGCCQWQVVPVTSPNLTSGQASPMKRFERLSDIKNQGSCSNEEKRAGDKKREIPMVLSL
jgi:hypothetical protein